MRHQIFTTIGLAGLLTIGIAVPALGAPGDDGFLGTAEDFAVLAGSTVTNTGPTVVTGALGVSPGSAVTGFPPGTVLGVIHSGDTTADTAQTDTTTAYNDIAILPPGTDLTGQDLGGLTLPAGVYDFATTAQLTGTLTLDAAGVADSVFIIRTGSTLTTASSSTVALINGADLCNVYWQIGSSATLGTNSTFQGTILALTSITATTGAAVEGRLLARNGAVTLDENVVTRPICTAAPLPTTTGLTVSPNPVTAGATTELTATVTGSTPTGTVEFFDGTSSLGSATVVGGTATLSITTLTPGDHTITAVYSGDGANATSTSAPVVVTVGAALPPTGLDGGAAGLIGVLLLAAGGIVLSLRRIRQAH
ncbi:MAG TPA: ice-binding family protein [Acidimicrobiales bacterium]|nr:ice-binding family protein [Acidimicrobiales bacterium]